MPDGDLFGYGSPCIVVAQIIILIVLIALAVKFKEDGRKGCLAVVIIWIVIFIVATVGTIYVLMGG